MAGLSLVFTEKEKRREEEEKEGGRRGEKMLAHAYSWPEPWIMPMGLCTSYLTHSWNINSCHSYAMRARCCCERASEPTLKNGTGASHLGETWTFFCGYGGRMIERVRKSYLGNLNWLDRSNYFNLIWIN